MDSEKLRILEMLHAGKIKPAEGVELLQALEEADGGEGGINLGKAKSGGQLLGRCLHIKVVSGESKKVNVHIPLKLIRIATKFAAWGSKFIPEKAQQEMREKGIDIAEIDFNELVELIDQGLVDGKLVDIDADDPKEGQVKVEIYVE